jgi:prolyl oligopeptidase
MKSNDFKGLTRGLFLLVVLSCGSPVPRALTPTPSPAVPPVASAAPPPAPTPTRPAWAPQYPASRVSPTTDTLFGTPVSDPYRWLEDDKAPDVQAWMKAQDDLARTKLAALPERDAIASRLKELFYVDTEWLPARRGGREFYWRRSGAQEKGVVYWRRGKNRPEEVLLDPNTWSADGSVSLQGYSVSWDGKRVAYLRSQNNADESTMYVLDVDTGKESAIDVIPGIRYFTTSWTPKGEGFYYTRLPVDPTIPTDQRPGYAQVRFHRLGQDPSKDDVVRDKMGDPTKFQNVQITKDGHFLILAIDHGWRANDLYFRDLRKKGGGWIPLAEGVDAQFQVAEYRDVFYVTTNEAAPMWRVMKVDPAHPARKDWTELVPERKDASLDATRILGGALALRYEKDMTSRLELHDLTGKLVREVALPAIGDAFLGGDDDQDTAYYEFDTFNYPPEIHEFSVRSGKDSTWFKQNLPVDPTKFAVDEVFVTSKDGTRAPMFVVSLKTTPRDGSAPTLLTGYGGFRLSERAAFTSSIIPWLERGGIYAVAALRGGGEYGEEWHRAGMRQQKQHVFDDFLAAADYLVEAKITSHDHLALYGASNGGLLVGAALVQRPDVARAVVCGVPLLDMVRYHLFGSGRTWIEEYGSAEDENDFRALYAYSPYHHVNPGTAYPAVLFESADSDDRVDPMHARKMAAALQTDSSGGPVIVRIERNAGHGGAGLMRARVNQIADRYAFVLAEIRKPGSVMTQ